MKNGEKAVDRVEWVDIAKGYGILLVIAAHMDISTLGVWIHTFHIPVFFFLSGYVFDIKGDFYTFFKKKVKVLIIPYFCLGIPLIIYDVIQKAVEGYYFLDILLEDIIGFVVQKRMFTLWYIACLFFVNILFYLIVKYIKNLKIIGIIIAIGAIVGSVYYRLDGEALPWNIDVCVMALPFWYLGYLFKKYDKFQEFIFNNKNKKLFFATFLCINIACGMGNCMISGEVLSMYGSTYGIELLSYISAFAGIMCVIMLANGISSRTMQYIGANSLIYFAWHQSLIIPLIYDVLELFNIFCGDSHAVILVTKAIVFAVCLIILTLLNILIKDSKLKFIIGR